MPDALASNITIDEERARRVLGRVLSPTLVAQVVDELRGAPTEEGRPQPTREMIERAKARQEAKAKRTGR